MIDSKTIELMNLVLDGNVTDAQRAELDERLAASPETRAHFDEMRRLVSRLDSIPMSDPPASLRHRVLSDVDAAAIHHSRHVPDAPGFYAWLRNAFTPPAFRYASVFGLGLVVGIVAWTVFENGASKQIDPSRVSGTIASPTPSGVVPVAVPEAGVSGSVAVVDRGSVTQVHLTVDEGGTEWVFDVPARAEPGQSVVLRVVKSGETVFERAVHPVEP
jgi:anti-sigma factor RsiW